MQENQSSEVGPEQQLDNLVTTWLNKLTDIKKNPSIQAWQNIQIETHTKVLFIFAQNIQKGLTVLNVDSNFEIARDYILYDKIPETNSEEKTIPGFILELEKLRERIRIRFNSIGLKLVQDDLIKYEHDFKKIALRIKLLKDTIDQIRNPQSTKLDQLILKTSANVLIAKGFRTLAMQEEIDPEAVVKKIKELKQDFIELKAKNEKVVDFDEISATKKFYLGKTILAIKFSEELETLVNKMTLLIDVTQHLKDASFTKNIKYKDERAELRKKCERLDFKGIEKEIKILHQILKEVGENDNFTEKQKIIEELLKFLEILHTEIEEFTTKHLYFDQTQSDLLNYHNFAHRAYFAYWKKLSLGKKFFLKFFFPILDFFEVKRISPEILKKTFEEFDYIQTNLKNSQDRAKSKKELQDKFQIFLKTKKFSKKIYHFLVQQFNAYIQHIETKANTHQIERFQDKNTLDEFQNYILNQLEKLNT